MKIELQQKLVKGLLLLLATIQLNGCTGIDSEQGQANISDSLLIQGARLIIGDGTVLENGALLVEGDRIVQVGASSELELPADFTSIDLQGKTIIPAMIDAHAHLGYEGFSSWGADNYNYDNMVDHLQRYAWYGFAAVFSAGSDPDDFALELQQSQVSGETLGARFLFAAGMAPPGQGPNNQFLNHVLAIEERTGMAVLRGAGSPEQGRSAVREIAGKGISVIKIWVDDRGGSQDKLEPAVYQAIIDEAKTLNLKVFVHQQSTEDMPGLITAGVSGFLHGRIGPSMDEQLVNQLKQSDAFIVPNLGLGELRNERIADDPFLQQTLADTAIVRLALGFEDRNQTATGNTQREQQLREGFTRLMDADVDIILGTDAGAVPNHFFGYAGHRELEIFVRLGMSPMQALVAATSKPAQRLGLDDLGTLEAGKSADFVVLDENPLEDIRNTRSISRVFLRGTEIDRQSLQQSWIDSY